LAFTINQLLTASPVNGKGLDNLPRRVQSGSTGYADKSDSYTILPMKTIAGAVKACLAGCRAALQFVRIIWVVTWL
jgi:hypothetical protein